MYSLSTLKKKAAAVGYSFQSGYRRYLHKDWGYVTDSDDNRIVGYQILDNQTGFLVYPSHNDLWDHALALPEAVALLQELIG